MRDEREIFCIVAYVSDRPYPALGQIALHLPASSGSLDELI